MVETIIVEKQKITGHLIAFITILIWGTTYISTKILLVNLTPVQILFIRFMIGYAALWILYPKPEKMNGLKEEFLFLSLGITGITFYFLLENIALQYTLASNVGLLIATAPMLTGIIAHYWTRDEKFKPQLLTGFTVAIVGVFLVIFNGRFILKINPLGDILAMLASVVWALYSVLLKKVNPLSNPIIVVRKSFFYGLVTIIPILLLCGNPPVRLSWNLSALLNILFLGLAASALCFVMWNKAVKTIGVVATSNYIYLVPLITMVTSIVVLHEKVNALMIVGGLLIVCGVYVSEKEGIRFLPDLKTNQG